MGLTNGYNNMSFWLYVIGLVVVVLSSIWLLQKGTSLSPDDIYYVSLLNLFAACLLVGGWWMRTSEDEETTPLTSAGEKLKEKAEQGKKTVGSWIDKLTGKSPTTSSSSTPSRRSSAVQAQEKQFYQERQQNYRQRDAEEARAAQEIQSYLLNRSQQQQQQQQAPMSGMKQPASMMPSRLPFEQYLY